MMDILGPFVHKVCFRSECLSFLKEQTQMFDSKVISMDY